MKPERFGVVGGSFMSGNSIWAIIGPLVALAGLAIAAVGVRRLRASGRASGPQPGCCRSVHGPPDDQPDGAAIEDDLAGGDDQLGVGPEGPHADLAGAGAAKSVPCLHLSRQVAGQGGAALAVSADHHLCFALPPSPA